MIDDRRRENLRLSADTSPRASVECELNAPSPIYGKPDCIVGDHGTEFTSHAIVKPAGKNGVHGQAFDPGKPQQSACIESFNGRMRDELFDEEISGGLRHARRKLALWRHDCTAVRPHSTLGNQTPLEARRRLEPFAGSARDRLTGGERR